MSMIDELIVRVKRGDSAATRAARDVYKWAMRYNLPQNAASNALFGAMFRAHEAAVGAREYFGAKLLIEPMVRARFHQVGKGVSIAALPYVRGHTKITLGDSCKIGKIAIHSGRFLDEPELIFGDHVVVSSGTTFVVNKRISIGSHTGIAGKCWIGDSDGHPTSQERREKDEDMTADDIHPLTIEDYVWIGHGCHVMKGITVGKGSVVAAGSTVVSDVPPGSLAMGVPARMLKAW